MIMPRRPPVHSSSRSMPADPHEAGWHDLGPRTTASMLEPKWLRSHTLEGKLMAEGGSSTLPVAAGSYHIFGTWYPLTLGAVPWTITLCRRRMGRRPTTGQPIAIPLTQAWGAGVGTRPGPNPPSGHEAAPGCRRME